MKQSYLKSFLILIAAIGCFGAWITSLSYAPNTEPEVRIGVRDPQTLYNIALMRYQEARSNVITAQGNRTGALSKMGIKESEFNANLEELQRDSLLDLIRMDVLAIYATIIKMSLDLLDHLQLTSELEVAIAKAIAKNDTLRKKMEIETDAWDTYVRAADNAGINPSARLNRMNFPDPLPSKVEYQW